MSEDTKLPESIARRMNVLRLEVVPWEHTETAREYARLMLDTLLTRPPEPPPCP